MPRKATKAVFHNLALQRIYRKLYLIKKVQLYPQEQLVSTVTTQHVSSLIQRSNSPFEVCHSQQQLQSDDAHPLLSVTLDKEPGQRSIPLATFAVTTILQASGFGSKDSRFFHFGSPSIQHIYLKIIFQDVYQSVVEKISPGFYPVLC